MFETPCQPTSRPTIEIVTLSQPKNRIAERGDSNQRSFFRRLIANKEEDVPPRRALVRNRPIESGVAPNVLEEEPGGVVTSPRMSDDFDAGLDCFRPGFGKPRREF